ncbi:DUF3551 domain-containing protein [Bradyrhizobium manausense]|uniref:DUF3551 domain-containing protein n=1 Tax=Bradyrhizobium manausense TaxID=989370 RepID=UPI003D9B29BA
MGIAIGSVGPASAEFSQYPFCLQGRDYPGWSGCSYDTLQACRVTASGMAAHCISNPWYRGGGSRPSTRSVPRGALEPMVVPPPPH